MGLGPRAVLAVQVMKVRLQIKKNGRAIYDGVVDATEAESFGKILGRGLERFEPAVDRGGYQHRRPVRTPKR